MTGYGAESVWPRETGLEYSAGQRGPDAHLLQYHEEQQAQSDEQDGSPRQVHHIPTAYFPPGALSWCFVSDGWATQRRLFLFCPQNTHEMTASKEILGNPLRILLIAAMFVLQKLHIPTV